MSVAEISQTVTGWFIKPVAETPQTVTLRRIDFDILVGEIKEMRDAYLDRYVDHYPQSSQCPIEADDQRVTSSEAPSPEVPQCVASGRVRKMFAAYYANGYLNDRWGGQPYRVRVFTSRDAAERWFMPSRISEIELWEDDPMPEAVMPEAAVQEQSTFHNYWVRCIRPWPGVLEFGKLYEVCGKGGIQNNLLTIVMTKDIPMQDCDPDRFVRPEEFYDWLRCEIWRLKDEITAYSDLINEELKESAVEDADEFKVGQRVRLIRACCGRSAGTEGVVIPATARWDPLYCKYSIDVGGAYLPVHGYEIEAVE